MRRTSENAAARRGRTPARRNVLKAPSRKILKPQVDISLVEGGGARAFT